jgi:polyhydroxybutyrate depolymerase
MWVPFLPQNGKKAISTTSHASVQSIAVVQLNSFRWRRAFSYFIVFCRNELEHICDTEGRSFFVLGGCLMSRVIACLASLFCLMSVIHCGKRVTPGESTVVDGGRQGSEASIEYATLPDTPVPPSPEPPPTEASTQPEPPVVPDQRVGPEPPVVPDVRPPVPEPSPEPPPVGVCQGKAQKSGETTWSLKHDGVTRTFTVYIPPQYNGSTPLPVVLNFLGLNMSASTQKLLTDMNTEAGKRGFIVVHPNGRGIPQSWNGGLCCSPASSLLKSKDVDFTRAMLDELEKKLCINTKRIYATGISNGAYMAYRLGCELSNRIAAIAPVAGILLTSPCQPKRPLSVIAFHGTADAIVPFEGRKIIGWPYVQDSIDFWVKHNGCAKSPKRMFNKGDTYCDEYSGCKGGTKVRLCVTKSGGHTWPGGFPVPGLGKTTKDINATQVGWQFMSQHQLP